MDAVIAHLSYSLATLPEAVQQFWAVAAPYRLIAFSGDMGAGKTTFISALCRHLGVTDAVSSPTFALVNEYRFPLQGAEQTIYHVDLYRLRDAVEAVNAGMEDCIDQARRGHAWCFVEWPEKAEELFSPPYLRLGITLTDMEEREMTITLVG